VLKSYLGDFNKKDASQHQLKWTLRRANRSDRVEKASACLVIELAQCDPEVDVDTLPTYQEASEQTDTNNIMIQIHSRPHIEVGEAPPPNYSETEVIVQRMEDMVSNYELHSLSASTSNSTIIQIGSVHSVHSNLVSQEEDKPEHT
jgi:hypothetical protein